MRDVPPDLAARLGGATTLCHCWQLALREGPRLGFTDHDEDVVFDALTHAARSGLRGEDLDASLGFAARRAGIGGALLHEMIDAAELTAGRLDGASLTTLLVDWRAPAARLVLDRAQIGAVTRRDGAFVAELRSAADGFDAPVGRLYEQGCSADFGDARCGVDAAALTQAARVRAFDGALRLDVEATGRPPGWFANGLLLWAGERLRIRDHRAEGQGESLVLWQAPAEAPAAGAAVQLVAGCDKSFATCCARFANGVNFRGFPHMPGNDLVLAAVQGGGLPMDGGSLFR